MKRGSMVFILILILIALILVSCFIYTSNSIPGTIGLTGSIDVDSKGDLYVLNNTESTASVSRINTNNIVDYHYSTKINNENNMFLFGNIFADDGTDKMYSIKNILDNTTNEFVTSEIVSFDPKSGYKAPVTVYTQKFDPGAPDKNQYINYIKADKNHLFFTTNTENLRTVYYRKINTDGSNTPETILKYTLPDNSLVYKTLCGENFIIVQTMDSKIYKIDAAGSESLIFPSKDFNEKSFALNLCLDTNNILYFTDIYSGNNVSMDTATGKVINILKPDTPVSSDGNYKQADSVNFSVFDKNTRVSIIEVENQDPFALISTNGNTRPVSVPEISNTIILFNALLLSAKVLLAILPVILLFILIRRIFMSYPTLLIKLAAFVLPIILIAMFFSSRAAIYTFDNAITKERNALVENVGNFVSQNIDLNLLEQINRPSDKNSEAHEKLLRSVSKASDYSKFLVQDEKDMRLYCVIMKNENGKIYTAVSADMPCYVPIDYLYSKESQSLYNKCLSEKKSVVGTITDQQGFWKVSIYPLFDSDGNIKGILETGINSKDLEASMLNLSKTTLLSSLLVALAVMLTIFVTVKVLLNPLKLLKKAVISVYNGDYGAQAVIKANDEVGDISRAFNKLSSELNSHFKLLTNLNQAYFKFVPSDTFKLLKKNSILDVNLGDQVSIRMTTMNSCIRNFESVSAGFTPEITFKFINTIFRIVSRNTSNYSGTIHSYNVDKVTSLFLNNAENALQAVIGIRGDFLNKKDSFSDTIYNSDTGFYIHTSGSIFGIVGEENRYSPAMVCDNNDIIYALDDISQKLKCSILVTQDAYDEIKDPSAYNYRYLGFLEDNKNNAHTKLYEFFDGDIHSVLNGKKQTLGLFNEAIEIYMNQDFYTSRNLFAQIVKVNSGDSVARWFLFKCDELCKLSDNISAELAISSI